MPTDETLELQTCDGGAAGERFLILSTEVWGGFFAFWFKTQTFDSVGTPFHVRRLDCISLCVCVSF